MTLAPLFASIREGRAIAVLGAGATRSCHDERGNPLFDSYGLAAALCSDMGYAYANEQLQDVVTAYLSISGEPALHRFLRRHFQNVTPSSAIEALTNVPWKRIYTFNIDDSLERVSADKRAQKYEFFNALSDRRRPVEGPATCQVVHLNGYVGALAAGIIFSAEEFTAANVKAPSWYEQAGDDYIEYMPVFIGTKLDEPILKKEIHRAGEFVRHVGRAYLVVPDAISPIKREALAQANIEHLQMSLEEFAAQLGTEFPGGYRPNRQNSRIIELSSNQALVTHDNVNIASQLKLIDKANIAQYRRRFLAGEPKNTNQYYRGFPPTWGLVASDTAIPLNAHNEVAAWVATLSTTKECKVVLGEAGCGKSTAVMTAIVRLAHSETPPHIYEFVENGRGLRAAVSLASKIHEGGSALIYVDDMFLYSEEISRIIDDKIATNIRFVGCARSSEWSGMVGKWLAAYADTFAVKNFEQADVDKIVAGIEKFVAAPAFAKLSPSGKRDLIGSSKRQLLILFKEITGERPFAEIIEDEFHAHQTRAAIFCGVDWVCHPCSGRNDTRNGSSHLRGAGHGRPLFAAP